MKMVFSSQGRETINMAAVTSRAKKAIGQLTTPENTIHTIMLFFSHPKILHKHCFQFLLGTF